MKILLAAAVLLQIVVAVQTEGLTRALVELSAFLLVLAIVFSIRSSKKVAAKIEAEEL
ncbi:hypothetical protein J4N42_04600 [Vibrio sp. SCSIO 43135]|uniref:hypothetical protein n=1 Tax=Vibrio sp. SCSIO 43135 TaxID=2819096 RepID=UPI002075D78A|nr:hypothetical protein [Vibrio sp. SCSIO 43135]USD42005.1 hypothetical protein J4N42_04600 [Vibrio sp. SCSIO 43135]